MLNSTNNIYLVISIIVFHVTIIEILPLMLPCFSFFVFSPSFLDVNIQVCFNSPWSSGRLVCFTVHTTGNVRRQKKKTNQKEEREAADFVGNYYFCDAVWLSGTSIAVSPELPYLDPRGVIVVCRELLD